MTKLVWDETGERVYETGVSNGVLYLRDNNGKYSKGVAWNGLINVNEQPTGAETTALYADNIKYLNLLSAEDFEASLDCYTYPKEFAECDGSAELKTGVKIGQQARKTFGLAYKTLIGNDVNGTAHGYKIHVVYGATASPAQKQYQSENDNPEAITFSYSIKTTPVPVKDHKATATMTFDSTLMTKEDMKKVEDALFGDDESGVAHLPLPDEFVTLLQG